MIKEKTGISYFLNAVVTSNIQGRTNVFVEVPDNIQCSYTKKKHDYIISFL